MKQQASVPESCRQGWETNKQIMYFVRPLPQIVAKPLRVWPVYSKLVAVTPVFLHIKGTHSHLVRSNRCLEQFRAQFPWFLNASSQHTASNGFVPRPPRTCECGLGTRLTSYLRVFGCFYLVPIRKSNWDSVVWSDRRLRASPWIPQTKTVRSSKFFPHTHVSLYTSPEAEMFTVLVLLLHVLTRVLSNDGQHTC